MLTWWNIAGSTCGKISREESIKNIADSINWVHQQTPGSKVPEKLFELILSTMIIYQNVGFRWQLYWKICAGRVTPSVVTYPNWVPSSGWLSISRELVFVSTPATHWQPVMIYSPKKAFKHFCENFSVLLASNILSQFISMILKVMFSTVDQPDVYFDLDILWILLTGTLDCKRDRHASIGKGHIGKAGGFERIINCRHFRDIPIILETPFISDDTYRDEILLLKSMLQDP